MQRKGAIGLSINTLVVIIISLVVLAGGITLLYKFIGGATDIKTQLDSRTNAELERLLVDQGKLVALPLHVATIQRGESHIFGIGILNIGEVGNQFFVKVDPVKVISEQEEDITGQVNLNNVYTWLLFDDSELTIKEGQHSKEIISVDVPDDAVVGQYVFNAKVFANNDQYGTTQKFYVTVK
jgi:hypothetical protein